MAAAALPKKSKPQASNTAALRDPVGFSKAIFGHDLWSVQRQILRSVWTNRRTAVKSCNASGKTFLAADATLAWVTTYPDGIVVTTAPTWSHVKTVLWGEIRNSVGVARTRGRLSYPVINKTELMLAEKNYAIGLSTNDANRISGLHSGHVLIIIDEAPGVKNVVWDAIAGLRAGGHVSVLAIGNPVIIGGQFYDAFTSERSGWETITISAFDTPNLHDCHLEYTDTMGKVIRHGNGSKNILTMPESELDECVYPTLCSRRWVKEIFEEWGPNHPYFETRVLGQFASQSDESLIPLSWLEQAKIRGAEDTATDDRPRAGLDVAGPGEDSTVLVVRKGPRVVLMRSWLDADPRDEVAAALAPFEEDLEVFNVDSIGVGWGIYLHFKDRFNKGGKNIVRPINVGLPSRETEKYCLAKAEYYWGLHMRAKDGDLAFDPSINPKDLTKLIGQLSTIRYHHNARNQIVIESKQELKARGIKSPDEAEAVMLSFVDDKPIKGLYDVDLAILRQNNWGLVATNSTSDNLEQESPWRVGYGTGTGDDDPDDA